MKVGTSVARNLQGNLLVRIKRNMSNAVLVVGEAVAEANAV
jgi:hypothetical protein